MSWRRNIEERYTEFLHEFGLASLSVPLPISDEIVSFFCHSKKVLTDHRNKCKLLSEKDLASERMKDLVLSLIPIAVAGLLSSSAAPTDQSNLLLIGGMASGGMLYKSQADAESLETKKAQAAFTNLQVM